VEELRGIVENQGKNSSTIFKRRNSRLGEFYHLLSVFFMHNCMIIECICLTF